MAITKIRTGKTIVFMPTIDDILDLKVGDLAPDAGDRLGVVTEILRRGKDAEGRQFVAYTTTHGEGVSLRNTLTADSVQFTSAVCQFHTSSELMLIQQAFRNDRALGQRGGMRQGQ